MLRKAIVALAAAAFSVVAAPAAHADVTCQVTGVLIIVAITGPVTLTCGGGADVTHTTTVTVDPSLQVDPHLLAPAPR